ncbi:hypothetical protein RQM65_17370 [Pricia sp. S334]|uniref:Uncharacterized protein n=1 Tax=Pricia mediterranea TaxID=3076079 RepID=A0ABU3LBJ2_9FLAO|nr:hypothetical protein [Pricia sp. S334]MDT7830442.1 hypothetical protein [Pricia sp. S334]
MEVSNTYSKVLYCVQTDTLWWRPASELKKSPIFRFTLNQFESEINNDFPKTEIPLHQEVPLAEELLGVHQYLRGHKTS